MPIFSTSRTTEPLRNSIWVPSFAWPMGGALSAAPRAAGTGAY
jgi:hypothetical protein